jgi:hypothetical protein
LLKSEALDDGKTYSNRAVTDISIDICPCLQSFLPFACWNLLFRSPQLTIFARRSATSILQAEGRLLPQCQVAVISSKTSAPWYVLDGPQTLPSQHRLTFRCRLTRVHCMTPSQVWIPSALVQRFASYLAIYFGRSSTAVMVCEKAGILCSMAMGCASKTGVRNCFCAPLPADNREQIFWPVRRESLVVRSDT